MDGRMVFWITIYSFAIYIKVSQAEYQGCREQSLVGINKLDIPDTSYTASSYFDDRYLPHDAKLYGNYGWAPKNSKNRDEYLQIDLGTPRVITAVATQGNGGNPNSNHYKDIYEWVKSYNMSFANNKTSWIRYKHKVTGNTDGKSVVRYDLKPPITAQYIRFIPLKYQAAKAMRVNVYVFSKLQVIVVPGPRSIRLTWTIKPCSLLNITGYTIRLNGDQDFKVNSSERKWQLKGLKTYTEYSVSVKAETQEGDEIWSNVERTRTCIEKPTAAPNIISIKAASSNSITIKLKKPAHDKINGPFLRYEITYTPQGRMTDTPSRIKFVKDVTTFNLTSLCKYTNYSITIAVRNTKYIGPLSKERKVRTMEDAPSAPVNLNSLFKPANGLVRPRVVITWGRPLKANGIIRNYTIIYYYNNMNTSNKVIVTNKEGTTNSLKYTVTVMCSGTFSYSIRATTIKDGPYASGKRITIPEYRCPEQSLVAGKEKNINVPNSSYTSSSDYGALYKPYNAKLHGKYGWAARDNKNPDEYLQIDLGTPRVITAVATQGNGGDPNNKQYKIKYEWVTSYRLNYSHDALHWCSYKNDRHKFRGNTDSSSVVRQDLENPITARYIRFLPAEFHGHKTMRVNVYLSFQEAPRIRILAIAQRSIKFCWTVKECSPAHPIKGYVVKLADKTGTSEKNTSGIEYTVTNLKPYTEYNVSVRAIRQVEYGTWSNITTTRTAIAKPEALPVAIEVEAKRLRSITVQWKLENADLIHGPFKGYRITYTPVEGIRNTKTIDVVCKMVTKCTTYTLKSLLRYTTYSVSVAVMNENYTGPARSARDIRTLEDKPETSPAITGIEARSSDSILLKWKKVDHNDINGIFKAYRITYTPQGGRTNSLDVGDVATYTLTSLLKYTTYTVTIAVMNEKFVGPPSTPLSIRTLEDAPSAPVNVTGTLIPPQDFFGPRVNITWDRPRDPNGIIRKYTIVHYYKEDTSNKETVIINRTSDLQYTLNVTKNRVLSFKISATTIKEGPYQSGNIAILSDRKAWTSR